MKVHKHTLISRHQLHLINSFIIQIMPTHPHSLIHVAFIEFHQVFDMVSRNKLWNVLEKNGLKGKAFLAI